MFSCDYVVNDLYNLVLMEIAKDRNGDHIALEEKEIYLRLRVSESLRQIPRMVERAQEDEAGEITVS
jgi:hypothetical protein